MKASIKSHWPFVQKYVLELLKERHEANLPVSLDDMVNKCKRGGIGEDTVRAVLKCLLPHLRRAKALKGPRNRQSKQWMC
jgi:hypothetical protein